MVATAVNSDVRAKFNNDMSIPPKPEQRAELLYLEPYVFKAWLERSKNYRKLDPIRVKRMTDSIAATGWVCDGSPFRMNDKSTLIDGQHRSQALLDLGMSVWAWVVSGIKDDEQVHIDTNKPRTSVDLLRHNGEVNATMLNAAIRCLWLYLNKPTFAYGGYSSAITTAELIRTLSDHPSIRESVAAVGATAKKLRFPGGFLAMLHYVISQKDVEMANRFCSLLSTGAGLGVDDPIHRFRARIIADRTSKTRLAPRDKYALLFLTWNLWIQGRSTRCLKWTGVGPSAAPFPRLILPDETTV